MVYAAALALAALSAAPPGDDGPALEWTDDLAAACERAGREDKLVLVRQILCDCEDAPCAYADLARRPAYLESKATREIVRAGFVPAVAHAPSRRADHGFHHPPYAPSDFRRLRSRVRTLLLTPTRHIVHRLDLCPHSYEVAAELQFALRIKDECYGRGGAAIPGGEAALFRLHVEHAHIPAAFHPSLGVAAPPGARAPDLVPSKGYGRGIAWHTDLAEARQEAARDGKLLLYFQIVGDLDTGLC